ncbi:MAG: Gfo/Idh/MocA family oxidoreductase [Treponema sp.]|jgi:myo-inositol 2-dehydrogenase/D-chiro-inositol 1-dehydrogenase/scyllo-inositol 2-dehydrogenase (NAD+)|nr:Gfo/Idh/MocA family oxidoreductase [Treponema sp.]
MKDTVGLCLIGAGRAGMIHARNFSSRVPHARMIAVSDVMEESAGKAAAELGLKTWYTDYRRALEDPAVDAVIVVTPTKFHHDIVIAAAEAKKHVFCEKPMAMHREECQRMIDAAEKNRVKLQIGFMRRFDANFRRAREIIDTGTIGPVVMVKSLTRGPSTPHEWMYDLEKSNGPLAEVNSHDIDTLRWLTGSEVESLYAIAGNYRCDAARERYPDFYDTVLMSLKMKNGMMGGIDGAQGVQYGYDARVDILGTCGSVQIGGLAGSTTVAYTREHRSQGDVVQSWTSLFHEAYVNEDTSFIEAIREDREPAAGGLDGMMAVDIVRAGNESIRSGRIVRL